MANIGTFNNQDGAIFQDNSVTIQQNQQNNVQTQQTAVAGQGENDSTSSEVLIHRTNDDEHSKVDLYRVIMALYQAGFFTTGSGARPTIKKVFQAFGQMLGEDFSKYANDLAAGNNAKNDIIVFQRLETAYQKYREEKDEKKNAR